MMRKRIALLSRVQLPAILVLAGFSATLMLMGYLGLGLGSWVTGYALMVLTQIWLRNRSQTQLLMIQALLLVGVAGLLLHLPQAGLLFYWVALLIGFIVLPFSFENESYRAIYAARTANLGLPTFGALRSQMLRLTEASRLILLPALLILAVIPVHGQYSFLVAIIVAIVIFFARYRVGQELRLDRRTYEQIRDVLLKYHPRFFLHWDAPGESKYQLDMWIPHLNDLNVPYVVIVRNHTGFDAAVGAAGSTPVVLARSHKDVERLFVPTLAAILYVNNADRNNQLLRFERFMHIMLSHGDSNKSTSATRIFRLFDRIYMAGQAGIDRFTANQIEIPSSRFAIVGRPQVKGIAQDESSISEKEAPTVLYAPTWAGDYQDSSYTSLPYAQGLVQMLLDRGCTIIFRPHPFTGRHRRTAVAAAEIEKLLFQHREQTGRLHLFGETARVEMNLDQCFNQSDAMIGDVSAVVSDFLYSGKPLGVFSNKDVSPASLEREGSYCFTPDASRWAEQLDRLLIDDPLRDRRLATRSYYLGNAGFTPPDRLFSETLKADLSASHGQQ